MTCTPPPGTKLGTLCILRRDQRTCVGEWDGTSYMFLRPNPDVLHGTLCDYHVPSPSGCRCGWVYAGTLPEAPRPQTAQEIAREQLDRSYPSDAACISALKIALERIANMPEDV